MKKAGVILLLDALAHVSRDPIGQGDWLPLEEARNVAAPPTSCLDSDCHRNGTPECDEDCIFRAANLHPAVWQPRKRKPVFLHLVPGESYQTWQEARRHLYLSASSSRGSHTTLELQACSRMRF